MNTLVCAWDTNRLIGSHCGLPWRIPDEMRFFRQMTIGHTIIMGRKTWDSLPIRPLPDRNNVVVSRQPGGVSLERALVPSDEEKFIIGGAEVYREALEMNLVHRMIISEVPGLYIGDTWFPHFDESQWDIQRYLCHDHFCVIRYTKKEGHD